MSALQNYAIALNEAGMPLNEHQVDTLLVVEKENCFWVVYDDDGELSVAKFLKSEMDFTDNHYFTGSLKECAMYVSNK